MIFHDALLKPLIEHQRPLVPVIKYKSIMDPQWHKGFDPPGISVAMQGITGTEEVRAGRRLDRAWNGEIPVMRIAL